MRISEQVGALLDRKGASKVIPAPAPAPTELDKTASPSSKTKIKTRDSSLLGLEGSALKNQSDDAPGVAMAPAFRAARINTDIEDNESMGDTSSSRGSNSSSSSSIPNVYLMDTVDTDLSGGAGASTVGLVLPRAPRPFSLTTNSRSSSRLPTSLVNHSQPVVLLPHLCQLVSLIARLCGDFMVYKFRDDVWPTFKHVLTNTADALRAKICASVTPPPVAAPVSPGNADTAARAEVILSLASFADNPECDSYFRPTLACDCVWMVLPLLSVHSSPVVLTYPNPNLNLNPRMAMFTSAPVIWQAPTRTLSCTACRSGNQIPEP